MKRRDFIKNIGIASATPLLVGGLPIQSFSQEQLKKILADSDSDKVLVLVQMHGGNDGLNTLIPVGKYDEYYDRRANVAIPRDGNRRYVVLDESVPEEDWAGLHPDMQPSKQMFDEGRMSAIQAVGYENMNMSHFRGRDIMFMGASYDEVKDSSWMGRFLDEEYPGYPDNYPNDSMLDPLGLELGNKVSLAFQRSNSIPAGISLRNPDAFYSLINETTIDEQVDTVFPDNYHGDELRYLNQFELKVDEYAERLKKLYDAGKNSSEVVYPESYPLLAPAPYIKNGLAQQLKIIARLLSGGIKTRIFLARIGGFDTHAQQVDESDATMGRHAALLYHVSNAIKAFHDDLKEQGLEQRVLTMTFSEFGRRISSNASYGTDHGKAHPVLLFGPGLKKKVHGPNPDLSGNNLPHLFDYREVYSRVLLDWLGSSEQSVIDSGFGDYINTSLDLFSSTLHTTDSLAKLGVAELDNCWPNPAREEVSIRFHLENNEDVRLGIYSAAGNLVQPLVNEFRNRGSHVERLNVSGLAPGNYIYRLEAGQRHISKILIVAD